jgi:ubiquinone biosynthesis protein
MPDRVVHDGATGGLAASGMSAVVLVGIEGGPTLTDDLGLYRFFGLALLLIASVMALRVLADVVTRSDGHR